MTAIGETDFAIECPKWGANVHNHCDLEHHLVDRATYETRRSAALAEWQSLMA
jgi:putative transposase